jgi:hypothetical protein
MYTIQLKTTNLTKNPYTKTTYKVDSEEVKTITNREYNLITCNDTVKCFRRLGGLESLQRAYTCAGYKVYKAISTSPDKQRKTIREFKFLPQKD